MAQRGREIQREEGCSAQVGGVTLSQLPLGVYVDGERRNLPLYTPGGYSWRPGVGDSVLVVKTEDGGAVVGTPQTEEISAGEVKITGGGGAIHLTAEGEIALTGVVTVNGVELETLIAQLVAQSIVG